MFFSFAGNFTLERFGAKETAQRGSPDLQTIASKRSQSISHQNRHISRPIYEVAKWRSQFEDSPPRFAGNGMQVVLLWSLSVFHRMWVK